MCGIAGVIGQNPVARVGVFGHGGDDRPILTEYHRGAWDLAHRISIRLGYFPPAAVGTAV